MRDLIDKDPSRTTIDRDTVVVADLIDSLIVEDRDSTGRTVKVPSIVPFIKRISLHANNYHKTAESRHASLTINELKALKAARKKEDDLIDLLIRGFQDERLKMNRHVQDTR